MPLATLRPFAFAASAFLSIAAACASAPEEPTGDSRQAGVVGPEEPGAPTGNPASPALPARWVALARGRAVVAVAGTNSSRDAADALARGEGTTERPLHHWQAVEAAATVLDLAGSTSDTIHAFGYGARPDPTVLYPYRALSGRMFHVAFLGSAEVAPGDRPDPLAFGTGQAKADAENLKSEIARRLAGRPVLAVGHSWGAAVVDYGQMVGVLDVPAISLGAPVKLFSNPFSATRLRDDGDHEGLLVVRRPDDPVRDENVLKIAIALFDARKLAHHDYTMAAHATPELPGGVWGLSGAGTLCSARYGGGCPLP